MINTRANDSAQEIPIEFVIAPIEDSTALTWKMTYANSPWGKGDQWSLFNVEDDPTEQQDLLAESPAIAARLLMAWEEIERASGSSPRRSRTCFQSSPDFSI